jgi:hypothetical protein
MQLTFDGSLPSETNKAVHQPGWLTLSWVRYRRVSVRVC